MIKVAETLRWHKISSFCRFLDKRTLIEPIPSGISLNEVAAQMESSCIFDSPTQIAITASPSFITSENKNQWKDKQFNAIRRTGNKQRIWTLKIMKVVTSGILMIAGACIALGIIHFRFWLMERARRDELAFSTACFSVAVHAVIELLMSHAATPEDGGRQVDFYDFAS